MPIRFRIRLPGTGISYSTALSLTPKSPEPPMTEQERLEDQAARLALALKAWKFLGWWALATLFMVGLGRGWW